jgi:hypothetical protein
MRSLRATGVGGSRRGWTITQDATAASIGSVAIAIEIACSGAPSSQDADRKAPSRNDTGTIHDGSSRPVCAQAPSTMNGATKVLKSGPRASISGYSVVNSVTTADSSNALQPTSQ